MEPSFPPEKSDTSVDNILNELIDSLHSHMNRFLVEDIKIFLRQWKPQTREIPEYFPREFKEQIKYLEKALLKESQEKQNQNLKSLKKRIEDIDTQSHNFWKFADIFFKTQTIKSLDLQDVKHLFNTLKKESQSDVEKKIKQLLERDKVEIVQFEKQIECENQNKKIPLKILIKQLVKSRPKSSEFYETVTAASKNCHLLKGHYIEINNEKQLSDKIRGRIIDSSFENDVFIFKIKTTREGEVTAYLHNNHEYFDKITIKSEKSVPMEEFLAKHFKDQEQYKYGKQCKIQHNPKQLSSSTIIPQSQYKLTKNKIENSEKYELHFASKDYNLRSHHFVVSYQEESQKEVIKSKTTKKTYTLKEFVQSYYIRAEIEREFLYGSLGKNNTLLKINEVLDTSTQEGYLEKLQEIYDKKRKLIGQLLSLEEKQLEKVLKDFITKKLNEEQFLEQNKMKKGINQIIKLTQEIKRQATTSQIVHEILSDTNYSSLVSKEETISSIKTIELLADSEKSVATMKGKDIISFYGNTGSGKSTSINYLMKVPLEMGKNQHGMTIVKIKEEIKNVSCKIGHSNVISETAFSKGHEIPQESKQEDEVYLSNVVLCDNPGFKDTRGASYELCTNFSIDRAVEVCASVNAIVLIIPYEAVTSDRGSQLITLIRQLEERFPRLLDEKSSSFERFFILITKAEQSVRVDAQLQGLFKTAAQQLSQRMKQVEKNPIERQSQMARFQIYNGLVQMCQDKRVDFIDIEDPEYQRKQLLQKYANTKTKVDKNEYLNTINSNFEMKKFINEINLAVHSWHKFILYPFFVKVPDNISLKEQIMQRLESKQKRNAQKILTIDKKIALLGLKMYQSKDLVVFHEKELKRVEQKQFTAVEVEEIERQCERIYVPEYIDEFERKIENLTEKISLEKSELNKKQKRLPEYREQLQTRQKQIQQISGQIKESQQKLKKLKVGNFETYVVNKSYELEDVMLQGSTGYSLKQRLEYLQRGQLIPDSQIEARKIVGKQKFSGFQLFKVSRNYILMPSKEFDPEEYLSKKQSIFGKYEAIIKSQGFTLEGAKLQEEGRVIFLCILIDFPITNNKKDLPFLQILHRIPNSEHNFDTIRNLDAQIRANIKYLNVLENQTVKYRAKIKNMENDIKFIEGNIKRREKQIQESEELNKKARKQKEKEMKGQTKAEKEELYVQEKKFQLNKSKAEYKDIYEKVLELQEQKQQIKQKNVHLKEEQKRIKSEVEEQKFTQKRLAFLIKNQYEKKIPQSLKEFIRIAVNMNKFVEKKSDIDSKNQQARDERMNNFKMFLDIYEAHEASLEDEVCKILANE